MKKNFYIITAAALSLVACSRNQEVDIPDANLSIFAKTESPADTKTVVESGVHVYWEPGDEIAVFTGEQSAKFTTDITAASGTATFKGTFGDATWPEDLDLWAVYPFSEDAVFDGETITTTLPSEQVAREGSFGKDMNLAIAHSNSSTLQFYNVGGGIRFSVTEEGIKKVMFEGLSGEIISGKVKIGMDENGKPEVREVTGGSQFITLLPPSGQEAFEPGVWYYIVAIPGSLEGGYKLRFYKDSDYARKVSEKKVEIKRSVFGNVEKADEGIEYGATTTKFPEKKEEWETSIRVTNDILHSWDSIIKSVSDVYDTDHLCHEIMAAENVASVECVDSMVIIKQIDGMDLYMLLETYDSLYYKTNLESETIDNMKNSIIKKSQSFPYASNEHRKALILLPFYSAQLATEPINAYKTALKAVGFSEENIKVWKNQEEAGYTSFYGDVLSDYDVVSIHTHGGYGANGTFLVTATKYDPTLYDSYLSDKREQGYVVCVANVDNFGGITTTAYIAMDSSFLTDASFHTSWIHLSACNTMKHLDLANTFLCKGAGLVTGYTKSVLGPVEAEPATKSLFKYLSQGISSTEALRQIDKKWLVEKVNENYNSYYLVDPHPKNLQVSEMDSYRLLSWDQDQNAGSYTFELYINDHKWHTTTEHSYKLYDATPGKYSWYVVAKLPLGGNVVASYRTDGEDFTVEEDKVKLEAIDLGLPSGLKWANMNIGANKPEEYGDYYAWGETEPYYSSLDPLTWKPGKEAGYNWPSYSFSENSYSSLTKYCNNSTWGLNGFSDEKTVLDLDDDVAHVTLGGNWRIPTNEELDELRANCNWEWKGNGYNVIGPNNHIIFLPANGIFSLKSFVENGPNDLWGFYWSSSLNTANAHKAFSLEFDKYMNNFEDNHDRFLGFSIRPVCE